MSSSVRGRGEKSLHGFTVIELSLALSLLSILALVAIPRSFELSQQSDRTEETATSSSIQTGIQIFRDDRLVSTGAPAFPPTLDAALSGPASTSNPFFSQVLLQGITENWVKESSLTYRGPAGSLYIYDPQTGRFVAADLPTDDPLGTPGQGSGLVASLGPIAFYESGAIANTSSSLRYEPNYEDETVRLTLHSGTVIQTETDGSALIQLEGGREIEVESLFGTPSTYTVTDDPEEGWDRTTRSVTVGRGWAQEGEDSTREVRRESSYDPSTRTTSQTVQYEFEGQHSGGSLTTDSGMIYETRYATDRPTEVRSTSRRREEGGYEGTVDVNYAYRSEYVYARNEEEGEVRWAEQRDAVTGGASRTEYEFDPRTNEHRSRVSGWHGSHANRRDLEGGSSDVESSYDFEGDQVWNRRTQDYEGSIRYRHRDGQDETYRYRYHHANRRYEMTRVDNRTGETRSYHWQGR